MGEAETKVVDFDSGENWGAQDIPLAHPFRLKGVDYRNVTLHTPSGDDVAFFYASTKPSVVELAKRLLRDAPAFNAMHAADVSKVLKATGAFLD